MCALLVSSPWSPLFCRPMSFESAKATETASELRKAREKIHDQEISLNSVEQEKKRLDLKVKELESVLDRRPQVSSLFVANKSEYVSHFFWSIFRRCPRRTRP